MRWIGSEGVSTNPSLGSAGVIDLSGNKPGYDSAIFLHCYTSLMDVGVPFTVRASSASFLLKLFREHRATPFDLIDITFEGGVWSLTLAKTAPDVRLATLVIPRYRCPGPVAEIMAHLRGLSPGQVLELVFYSEHFERELFVERVEERGYSILRWRQFPPNLFIIHLAEQGEGEFGEEFARHEMR